MTVLSRQKKGVNLPKKNLTRCDFSQALKNLTLESPLHIQASTSIKKKLT